MALLIVTKILGPTHIARLTSFHFVSALILGELLGNAVYEKETSVAAILYTLALWCALMYLLEWVSLRFPRTRGIVQGNPEVLIKRGLVQRETLKRKLMNLNELQMLLRKKEVFSLREVEYAVLEPDGSLSVLRKPVYATPTKQDLNLPPQQGHVGVVFIAEGKVLNDNVKDSGFDITWLYSQLSAQGVRDPADIFYAEWQEGQGLLIQQFEQEYLPPV